MNEIKTKHSHLDYNRHLKNEKEIRKLLINFLHLCFQIIQNEKPIRGASIPHTSPWSQPFSE